MFGLLTSGLGDCSLWETIHHWKAGHTDERTVDGDPYPLEMKESPSAHKQVIQCKERSFPSPRVLPLVAPKPDICSGKTDLSPAPFSTSHSAVVRNPSRSGSRRTPVRPRGGGVSRALASHRGPRVEQPSCPGTDNCSTKLNIQLMVCAPLFLLLLLCFIGAAASSFRVSLGQRLLRVGGGWIR